MKNNVFFSALVLGLGILMAGFFIGQTAVNANVGANTVEVRGLSERRVKSDRVHWVVAYNVTRRGDSINRAELYAESEKNQAQIILFLKNNGLNENEIEAPLVHYNKMEYRDGNQRLVDVEHRLSGSIGINSGNIDLINQLRVKISDLIRQGIELESVAPQFYFTSLNQIKPEMLKDATLNAKKAAEELANHANVKVGKIKKAVQGSFVIRDLGSDYSDNQSVEKTVRLVTTVTFFLK